MNDNLTPAPTGRTALLAVDKSPVKLEKFYRLCRKNRQGAAAVEFALIAPVFFVLIMGMIEYGRMVMVQQILTNAAREGARVAVLDGATTAQVQSQITSYLSNASIGGATVTVSPNPPTSAGYGAPVTVTVSVPFNQVSWLPVPIFLNGTNMLARSVMRREAAQ